MACALAAVKLNIKLAHVEAGIRSFNPSMPEEMNRLVVDSICYLYYTTTVDASNQLINEGVDIEKIAFVGNTMVYTLVENFDRLKQPVFWDEYSLSSKGFLLLTLYRPSNVDDPVLLRQKIDLISKETQP
jgi:UDP-N-acetylglucosamine 2-epimerase (non-hydrolysing)